MRTQIGHILTAKSGGVYRAVLESISEYDRPHQFVKCAYDAYQKSYSSNNRSINGKILEFLICETLARENIGPFYYQAQFNQVPNVEFDIVLYHPHRPVVLSVKTSLRERYKQADLEGKVLCQVYRSAKSHMLTLDKGEAKNLREKISAGSVSGLNSCVRADQEEYDQLLKNLSKDTFSLVKQVLPLSGTLVRA